MAEDKPVKKRLVWTPELDDLLLSMHSRGMKHHEMGSRFGVAPSTAGRRLRLLIAAEESRLKQQSQQDLEYSGSEDAPLSLLKQQQNHLKQIQAKRRGFYVPSHLEGRYYDLLKSGKSIEQIRKTLGL